MGQSQASTGRGNAFLSCVSLVALWDGVAWSGTESEPLGLTSSHSVTELFSPFLCTFPPYTLLRESNHSFICSFFFHAFNKCLLNTYSVSGIVLQAGITVESDAAYLHL